MPMRRSGNLTTFICRFCYDLVASTSWSSQDLSRPLIALLYSTLNKRNRVVFCGVFALLTENIYIYILIIGKI